MTFRKYYLLPLFASGLLAASCGGSDDGNTTENNPAANGNASGNGSGNASGTGNTSENGSGASDNSNGQASGGDNSNSSSGQGINTGIGGTNNGLTLKFSPMYSAYNGVQTFKVPVQVEGATGPVEWTASDPNMVDIVETPDGAMLTTLAAGQVTIMAKSGDLSGSALLTITEATAEDWEIGKERYNNGVPAFNFPDGGFPDPGSWDGGIPDLSQFADGGFPSFGDGGPGLLDPDSACTSCHGVGSDSIDVEHTPQQTAGYSDDQLIAIFTMGQKPEGVGFNVLGELSMTLEQGAEDFRMQLDQVLRDLPLTPFPNGVADLETFLEEQGFDIPMFDTSPEASAERWSRLHQWNMTEEDKHAIVVYLRSLEPKSQGPLDFGGFPDLDDIIDQIGEGGFGDLFGGGQAGGATAAP